MMEMSLGVLCLSGWLTLSTCLPRQYHYVADSKNWTEAQTYCRETYTDLATVENKEEMNQLNNTVLSAGYNSEVWIGLYSKNDWRWSDGHTGGGAEYRRWDNGQPRLYNTALCVKTGRFGDDFRWWDYDCSYKYASICYNGTKQDPQFIIVTELMDWSSARRYCREKFVDLATVRNNTENRAVQSLVGYDMWTWIGLFRDLSNHWSDGSNYSFSLVTSSVQGTGVKCGAAALKSSGQWILKTCETKLPFVCYSIRPHPVKRQLVKMKMKLGDSVDLNDPTVKADILSKLHDRLKERGVSGVTLRWREWPDGKIFHKEGKSSQK